MRNVYEKRKWFAKHLGRRFFAKDPEEKSVNRLKEFNGDHIALCDISDRIAGGKDDTRILSCNTAFYRNTTLISRKLLID